MPPSRARGQRPVRERWARIQLSIRSSVCGGRDLRFGRPRERANSRARESPPGRPRSPSDKADSAPRQVSPGASAIGPELRVGHEPVRCRWASAQVKRPSGVRGGSAMGLRTPRCSARTRANEPLLGKPRLPVSSAAATADQASPGTPSMGPEVALGHRPDRERWRAAQAKTVSRVKGVAFDGLRTPRSVSRSRASDEPPGIPRRPLRKAESTACHVSPGVPGIGPEWRPGHSPVRSRWASAQIKIWGGVIGAKSAMFRLPRRRARNRASESPPGRPRLPPASAESTADHDSPGDSGIGPHWAVGHRPTRSRWRSAQAKISGSFNRGRSPALRTPNSARQHLPLEQQQSIATG